MGGKGNIYRKKQATLNVEIRQKVNEEHLYRIPRSTRHYVFTTHIHSHEISIYSLELDQIE